MRGVKRPPYFIMRRTFHAPHTSPPYTLGAKCARRKNGFEKGYFMRKKNKRPQPRNWKRRRGRIVESRLRLGTRQSVVWVSPGERLAVLLRRAMLPGLLSETARRLGCPFVSPQDYFCGCTPCAADGLPICDGVKRDCRFAGRWTRVTAAAAETPLALRAYEYRYEMACLAYGAQDLQRLIDDAIRRGNANSANS